MKPVGILLLFLLDKLAEFLLLYNLVGGLSWFRGREGVLRMTPGCSLRFFRGGAGGWVPLLPKLARRLRVPLTTTGLSSVEDIESTDGARGGFCADTEEAEVFVFELDAFEPPRRDFPLEVLDLVATSK